MSIGVLFIIGAGLFLAFANGANDNFKGVATLLGSKTTSYRVALLWATLTTGAGSIAAFFLAQKLMVNFSGKGLVPDSVALMESFAASVAIASAATVFLATRFGFPISTTHALTGALVGAGFFASPEGVSTGKLWTAFFIPLLISPVIAIFSTMVLYPVFSFLRVRFGVTRESCLCIGNEVLVTAPQGIPKGAAAAVVQLASFPQVSVGTKVTCEERYVGHVWGLSAKDVLDKCHFLSSGLVGFARGLNDTPKIAAVLLLDRSLSALPAIVCVAVAIAVGGVLMARRIAETMSFQITEMNDGQGFSANLVTNAVLLAPLIWDCRCPQPMFRSGRSSGSERLPSKRIGVPS
jgi:PiT family inorganic phosphate transporter